MQTTIDSGGRVVIPKDMRDALGLRPGQRIDIAMVDGRISIDVSGIGMHLDATGEVPVLVPEEPVSELTTEQVRATIEGLRR